MLSAPNNTIRVWNQVLHMQLGHLVCASAWSLYCPGRICLHIYTWAFASQVTELNVTTPSTVPPSFTVVAVSNFTEGNAMLTVATNETAIVYYLVMLGQATAVPSAGQVGAHNHV